VPVDIGQQASRRLQPAVDEKPRQDQPHCVIGDLCLPPQFDLALHRLEVALHAVHTNGQCVNQVKALGVLGQHGSEIAAERHIGADKHAQARGQAHAKRLVMRITDTNRKAASFHLGLEIENSKYLLAVIGSGIFFIHHRDVAKAQGFKQRAGYKRTSAHSFRILNLYGVNSDQKIV
jgi:hypothetical protein